MTPMAAERQVESGARKRLTIFAATGGIGRQLVAQALAAHHEVTAVVRNPRPLPPGIRAITADLSAPDTAALRSAVAGADAVISALGPRAFTQAGVALQGTRAIIDAMKATGVRRLMVVSAAPISTFPSPGRPHPPRYDPGEGIFMSRLLSPLVKKVLHERYDDLARMEDALRDSGLDWTIIRPPRLTNGPLTGQYRTAYGQNIKGGARVSRANVAHFMLATLDEPATIRQAIGIAS
jgi:putative NADH-flavin reductase